MSIGMSTSETPAAGPSPLDDALALATRVDAYTVTGRFRDGLLLHGGNQPDHWAEVYDTQITTGSLRVHAAELRAAADVLDAEADALDLLPDEHSEHTS
jgi:hypothetical protein